MTHFQKIWFSLCSRLIVSLQICSTYYLQILYSTLENYPPPHLFQEILHPKNNPPPPYSRNILLGKKILQVIYSTLEHLRYWQFSWDSPGKKSIPPSLLQGILQSQNYSPCFSPENFDVSDNPPVFGKFSEHVHFVNTSSI